MLLVVAVAAQSLLVALVQHYGYAELHWLQPVTASALPPQTWCAFVAVQMRKLWAVDAWHGLAPLFVLLGLVFGPDSLDPLVIGTFLMYGALILLALGSVGLSPEFLRIREMTPTQWLQRAGARSEDSDS